MENGLQERGRVVFKRRDHDATVRNSGEESWEAFRDEAVGVTAAAMDDVMVAGAIRRFVVVVGVAVVMAGTLRVRVGNALVLMVIARDFAKASLLDKGQKQKRQGQGYSN